MKFTAIYKTERKDHLRSMTSEYNTKTEFRKDLKQNGYITIAILTDKEIEDIKNNEYTNKYLNLDLEYVKQCL